jgi:glucose-6-phosphate isomerase
LDLRRKDRAKVPIAIFVSGSVSIGSVQTPMNAAPEDEWDRFQQYYAWYDSIGLGLDFSRTRMPLDYAHQMQPLIDRAFADMQALEEGGIANADENRMVGHYWLRNPAIAPTAEIRREIEQSIEGVKVFASEIHAGTIQGAEGSFRHILLVGIGGSALGPQFVSQALGHPRTDKLQIHFLDNTDPDGFDRVLADLGSELGRTLCLVISKSGATKETRNGMIEVQAAYQMRGLAFPRHSVAVTAQGSELAQYAKGWLRIFPMWDWIGGRTSELSVVGLLPAALQGFDVDALLLGAKCCDNVTRTHEADNPAIRLALFWSFIGSMSGGKSMVVLPYKDRLELFSKYLQQLVMESLGKRTDREGKEVNQGLSVFGNKGSTDQHAYVQQLRDGLPNFFCILIEVLKDRDGKAIDVEPDVSSGDYLTGFLLGTRDALFERNRESLLMSVERVDAFHIGMLIALFERAVGYYASLININAYHQPGVEAGKKAAANILQVQTEVLKCLSATPGKSFSAVDLEKALGARTDIVFRICEHLATNGRIRGEHIHLPARARFSLE